MSATDRPRRVVVTGFGALTPLGTGAEALHARAVAGQASIVGGLARCDFDTTVFVSRKDARRMDRFTLLALGAGLEATAQAGWTDALPTDPGSIQCFIGTAIGGLITIEDQLAVMRVEGGNMVSPLTVPLLMANAAAAQLTIRLGLRGESAAVSTACTSGASAILAGARSILAGDADAAIVGGAEAMVTDFSRAMFAAAGALSRTGRSVPFERTRDGFILGEGAGVLVLESEDVARRRGAQILGTLIGYGSSSDGHHVTAPEPSGSAAAGAMRQALDRGGAAPADISYINAHGTGTILNDATEARALHAVFGDALSTIPVSSTKSSIGHLMGAAGAVEAIATIQALRRRHAPPTVGLADPDPDFGGLRLIQEGTDLTQSGRGYLGLSNSFGFGGHNVSLLFESA